MTIASANWAELLEPGLREIFQKQMGKLPDMLPVLFKVKDSKKAVETSLGIGHLGLMQAWNSTNNQVSYQDFAKGYKSTLTHVKYSLGMQLERELRDDDQYDEIEDRVTELVESVWYTRQTHAASVFNNAFNASYTGPDSKALCSSAHPHSPTDSTTQSNTGTTALDAAAVETTRIAMQNWTDDQGKLLLVRPDTILVPPDLGKAARVIAESEKEPDTSDNNTNVWKGRLKVIEWDFLTDTNNWFMIDSRRAKRYLRWFDRRKPKLERDGGNGGEDFDTENAKWKCVGRWSYGWYDWSWIYGHNVA